MSNRGTYIKQEDGSLILVGATQSSDVTIGAGSLPSLSDPATVLAALQNVGARLAALEASPGTTALSGVTTITSPDQWVTVAKGAATQAVYVQSRLYLTPIWLPSSTTFDNVAVESRGTNTSATARVGAYAALDGRGFPTGLPIYEESGIDVSPLDTVVTKALADPPLLPAGLSWLALVVQGAGATLRGCADTIYELPDDDAGGNDMARALYLDTVTGALPNLTGASLTPVASFPLQWLQVA